MIKKKMEKEKSIKNISKANTSLIVLSLIFFFYPIPFLLYPNILIFIHFLPMSCYDTSTLDEVGEPKYLSAFKEESA